MKIETWSSTKQNPEKSVTTDKYEKNGKRKSKMVQ